MNDTVVLPGDAISETVHSDATVLKLGPGLTLPSKASTVTVSHAGILGHQPIRTVKEGTTESWWVEVQGRRVNSFIHIDVENFSRIYWIVYSRLG